MRRTLMSLSGGLLGIVISSQAYADLGSNGHYSGEHPMMWGNWFMGPMMMLFMIAIVVVAVIIVMKMIPSGDNDRSKGNEADSAVAILNERFAKGEIDKTEYEDRKNSLLR